MKGGSIHYSQSAWPYLGAIILILLLALGLRVYALEADAPTHLSPSQELNLDGPVTISAGRDRAVFGSWEPHPGPLKPQRLYPGMTWLSYLFFRLFGTGFWQANFISAVTGFLSVVFMAAFARQQFGRRVALLAALFLGTSYVYVMYNRLPMAYTPAACGMALSLYCWGRGLQRPAWFFVAGAVMIFNGLFIKLPGIAFLPAALLGFLALFLQKPRHKRRDAYVAASLFAAGTLLMAAIWLFFIYLPDSRVVSQAYYVRTFNRVYSFEENLRFAVQSLLQFGVDFGFTLRMLPLFALAYGYLFYRGSQLLSRDRPVLSAGEVVVLTLLVSTAGMLLLSAIRPMRFLIMLIPPISLVAALALDAWLRSDRLLLPARFGRLYPIFIQAGLAYFFYQVLAALLQLWRVIQFRTGLADARVMLSVETLYMLLAAGLLLAIVGTMALLWRVIQVRRPYIPLPGPRVRQAIAVFMLIWVVGGDLYQYGSWARQPQFSIVAASRQIGAEFDAAQTILAGTYAYTLALENKLPAVWFYGHSPAEAILATHFTHLVIEAESPFEEDYLNDQRIWENLPEFMERARLIDTYNLRGYLVRVYEVEP